MPIHKQNSESTIRLKPADIPLQGNYDVIVCGGGPAGIAAAITAGRSGAKTCLVEHHGYLGGIWTAGLLSFIIDARTIPGLVVEIRDALARRGAVQSERDLYDAEAMKLVLEELSEDAGVEVRLYTQLVSSMTTNRELTHVVLEAKEGCFALAARAFVDATGDGDLAARSGCSFDIGRPKDGLTQPMTLMALVSGVPKEVTSHPYTSEMGASCINKVEFCKRLTEAGYTPSYTMPSLFPLTNGLCGMMANHQYGASGLDSSDLTRASIDARRELEKVITAMKRFSGEGWDKVCLVASAPAIGVRETRRIRGRYQVCLDDLMKGSRHPDAITRATFPIDVHSIVKSEGGGFGSDQIHEPMKPYDIPMRALIATDVDNLVLAGRCISGDFYAHASYRVTGTAVATGEAAGLLASHFAQDNCNANSYDIAQVLEQLATLRNV
jgi:hypothetical protein